MTRPEDTDIRNRLLVRDPEAPSDWELDRMAAGELDSEEVAALRDRLGEDGRARLAERELGWAAHSEVDADALFGRISARLDAVVAEPAVVPEPPLWKRIVDWLSTPQGGGFALAAAAAAVAIVVIGTTPEVREEGMIDPIGTDRAKGSLQLRVFCKRGERSGEMASGERFRSGDVLRFVVDVPATGHALIIHRDALGAEIGAWPLGAQKSVPVAAGKAQELEGAVELDDARGAETLTLIRCDEPFAADAVPSKCSRVTFELDKGFGQ